MSERQSLFPFRLFNFLGLLCAAIFNLGHALGWWFS